MLNDISSKIKAQAIIFLVFTGYMLFRILINLSGERYHSHPLHIVNIKAKGINEVFTRGPARTDESDKKKYFMESLSLYWW